MDKEDIVAEMLITIFVFILIGLCVANYEDMIETLRVATSKWSFNLIWHLLTF